MKPEYAIGAVTLGLVGIGLAILLTTPTPTDTLDSLMPNKGTPYVEIVRPSGFVNTGPITLGELVGKKVILIDFLTYSCINCQRTFPYVDGWYEKYKDDGLEIIGIHTPEFAFEKNIDNVVEAMQRFGITHPIVLDNEYATWNAYGNRYWPRRYLIDIHGNVVYDHIGEGAYGETEQKIVELLSERKRFLGEGGHVALEGDMSEAPDLSSVKSPETYFGSARNQYLGNGTQMFVLPQNPDGNTLYLGGTWNIKPEYAEAGDNATVEYYYSAKNIYTVAESSGGAATVTIVEDGAPATPVTVTASTLYLLMSHPSAGPHIIRLTVPKGVRLYTFTFG